MQKVQLAELWMADLMELPRYFGQEDTISGFPHKHKFLWKPNQETEYTLGILDPGILMRLSLCQSGFLVSTPVLFSVAGSCLSHHFNQVQTALALNRLQGVFHGQLMSTELSAYPDFIKPLSRQKKKNYITIIIFIEYNCTLFKYFSIFLSPHYIWNLEIVYLLFQVISGYEWHPKQRNIN